MHLAPCCSQIDSPTRHHSGYVVCSSGLIWIDSSGIWSSYLLIGQHDSMGLIYSTLVLSIGFLVLLRPQPSHDDILRTSYSKLDFAAVSHLGNLNLLALIAQVLRLIAVFVRVLSSTWKESPLNGHYLIRL